MVRLAALATASPLLLSLACASLPLGAQRGEIVVRTDTGDTHIKSVELQHQDFTHAVSISGFERGHRGHSNVRKEVVAGHYCVERMIIYEIGAVAGGVLPRSLCFEVLPGEVTEIHVRVDSSGRAGIAVQRAISPVAPDPNPPLGGSD